MRLRLITVACALLGAASPSWAQSPSERFALTHNALSCESLYQAGQYTPSMAACDGAIKGFEHAAVLQRSAPWYAYYMKANMLEYKAYDLSGLTHHRAALKTAVEAHQLARYVYTNFHIDRDDYRSINELVQRLLRFETQEQRRITAGEGD